MFRRLVLSAGISGLGDGVTKVSGALLAASLTRSPLAVAGLMICQLTAVTLLALPAGTLVDRVDRRVAMVAACLIRLLAVGALACWLATGSPPLAMLYAVYLVLGLAGVVYENAASAMLPAVAGPGTLERSNGRLQSASGFSQSLVAQPLAAVAFTAAVWLPFTIDAAGLLVVASLSASLPSLAPAITERSIWPDMRAGLRWLAGSRELGALSLAVAASNIGLGAVFSVLVLIVRERFCAGPLGYSALLTVIAVAGLAGGLAAGAIVARFGRVRVLRVEMISEALTHAGLLLTRSPVVAGGLLAVLSFQLAIFSSVSATLRQTIPPPEMLGRAHGAYRTVSGGGMLLGAVFGGVLSNAFGLTAPFWLGLSGMCIALAYGWNRILPGVLYGSTFLIGKYLSNEERNTGKMQARIGRVLLATAAAAAAVALTASQAMAATWTVTGGGTIHSSLSKGTTLAISVKTTTFGTITISCKTATLSGTLPNGKGLPGTGIGHITGATFGSSSTKCTGPAGSTGTGTITKGSKWALNAVSYSSGVTAGTITGTNVTVSFKDPLGSCTAVMTGTLKDSYTNTTGLLKVAGSLAIKSGTGAGCGGSLAGDTASISSGTGGYDVLNATGGHPHITSP
jgi:MFS family permease